MPCTPSINFYAVKESSTILKEMSRFFSFLYVKKKKKKERKKNLPIFEF